jgi:glycosyltransferase involved in cell wall biosynthesis
MSDRILVSICCVTFNHQQYIKYCLDGFLMQQGDFDIEVLIHDDASTDGTKQIIEAYKEKYPDIFFPVFQNENQYSKGFRGFTARYNFPRCRGKYIALCEGDDYWTDTHKLQKQIDFLEANEKYVITCHDSKMINQNGEIINSTCLKEENKRDYSAVELKKAFYVLTQTMCFRNVSIIKNMPVESRDVSNGDIFLISLLGAHGKHKFISDIKPSAYRIHSGGVWSQIADEKKNKTLKFTAKRLRDYYKRIGDKEMEVYHSKKALMYSSKELEHVMRKPIGIKKKFSFLIEFVIDNKLLNSCVFFIKYLYFNKLKIKR